VTWGTGTTGALTADVHAVRVRASPAHAERWLLCKGSSDDVRKFYLLSLEATVPLKHLVAMARARWPIEQQYRKLKDELGLDHLEGRSYRGWTHHVVLTAIAFTFLQLERGRSDPEPRPTLPVVRGWVREVLAILYVIHNRRLLNLLDRFRRNPPLRR
jgi:SRSO17 transposase